MIDYTLQIKKPDWETGVEYKGIVHRGGYATSWTPVYSRSVTTLDGVTHDVVVRRRGGLRVRFNPLTASADATLCTLLATGILIVTYYSIQRGQTVTETMRVTNVDSAVLAKVAGTQWIASHEIEFEEV